MVESSALSRPLPFDAFSESRAFGRAEEIVDGSTLKPHSYAAGVNVDLGPPDQLRAITITDSSLE